MLYSNKHKIKTKGYQGSGSDSPVAVRALYSNRATAVQECPFAVRPKEKPCNSISCDGGPPRCPTCFVRRSYLLGNLPTLRLPIVYQLPTVLVGGEWRICREIQYPVRRKGEAVAKEARTKDEESSNVLNEKRTKEEKIGTCLKEDQSGRW